MSDQQSAVKNSVYLPQTDFPMKANLNVKEPELIAFWQKEKVYQSRLQQNAKAATGWQQKFSMPDGPPYANGHIHMGHTLNKCLKDFVIKYKSMAGYEAPYIPGWDCHGLPIEHNITKQLGGKIREKSDKEIRQLCRQEAQKWVDIQREEFIRLGILGDWQNPYLTMDPSYEAEEVREFKRCFENGVLVRGKKPVYWCIPLQTALAEAEIEYQNHKSPSIYVKFPYQPSSRFGAFSGPVFCVIWTTTPWTLPANLAICLNPDLEYGFYQSGHETLLLAREMAAAVEKANGLTLIPPTQFFKGSEFEFEKAQHPFMERESVLILGDHVTLDAGTGLVHTAPGHGPDDYQVGLRYQLPLLSPVTPDGRFTPEVPQYQGQKIFEANEVIIADLKSSGHLLGRADVEHSYPHCWRSKAPLIFRATSQWFIKMDDKEYPIREKALASLADIRFTPDWGVKRLTAMIENRPDWCISRQRNWGVPLPVLYCQDCDEPLLRSEIMETIAVAMEKGAGLEAYYEIPIASLIPADETCSSCGGKSFVKGQDILDVWFDSGICHAAVQRKRDGLDFPADLYLEGSDQHRGWFQTSLLTAIASSDRAPFKHLLTHNFVNDAQGRKMSKSLGNVVDPLEMIKKSGAELLRLWAASQDYGQDMNFSQEGFQRVTESYRRLRNTVRFLLGNLGDFDFDQDQVAYKDLTPLDQWALHELTELVDQCQAHYDRFEFYRVYHLLNNFFTVTLSNHYLDMIKDRLYTWKRDGRDRRAAQTVLFQMTDILIRLMAPITSFLSEEAYSHFPGKKQKSVFLEPFPGLKARAQGTPAEAGAITGWSHPELATAFRRLLDVRQQVSKKLEEARNSKMIGASLEAEVHLILPEDILADLERLTPQQRLEFFIVSGLQTQAGEQINVQVQKASGEKCPRCWNYAKLVETSQYGQLCPKCHEALK